MIRIGPAGWSYDDWNGIVYPSNPSRGFDRLGWIAHQFDTVEVNASFYHIPAPSLSRSWVGRVANPRFSFTVKLHRSFTHDTGFPTAADAFRFRQFLDPLQQNDRLGAVLVQFPWSVRYEETALRRMTRIFEAFPDVQKAVEVRHSSFDTPDFRRFLRGHRVAIVNIDQPAHRDSIRPSVEFTAEPGYVRFHGRNLEKWFNHDQAWERYDYLYSPEELDPLVDQIEKMPADNVFVVMNNHFRGQAVVNALEAKRKLGQPIEVTPELATAYPGRFETPPGAQTPLFTS